MVGLFDRFWGESLKKIFVPCRKCGHFTKVREPKFAFWCGKCKKIMRMTYEELADMIEKQRSMGLEAWKRKYFDGGDNANGK